MDRGKAVVNGGVSVEGTSGLLPHEKLKVKLKLSDLEGSMELTTPLNLSERDEEDEDVEYEVEPDEDPEEDPEEDLDEEPEEDPEEEPERNHMEYHVEQSYKMFHMPYVEYTPSSPGTYWERLYKDEIPQAQLEIHSLKRKIKEIDEHRSRLVQENQIRVVAVEKKDLGGLLGSPRRKNTSQLELMLGHQEMYQKPHSGSHRSRGRGRRRGHAANTITREELADEIARTIRDTLPDVVAQEREAIMGEYKGKLGGGEEEYKYNTPNMSREPSIAQPSRNHGNHDQRGCSYKTFINCKPPIFNGEIDPVLSSTWIMEIEGTFDISTCADEDKVIYVATLLKGEAIHWWGMVKEVKGREAAKRMSWNEFLIIFKENF
ncbi:unnamed protein product [Lactuca saligna]|uniref:Retrotransposon gag domain-containing protein n=1 Tax=Lactuca saligna TaxID=75948 RepID=A0AA35YQL3_LACSI|nr:unnamed protein product [Lactuca saligna]